MNAEVLHLIKNFSACDIMTTILKICLSALIVFSASAAIVAQAAKPSPPPIEDTLDFTREVTRGLISVICHSLKFYSRKQLSLENNKAS